MRWPSQSAAFAVLFAALIAVCSEAQELQWTTWEEAEGGNGHQYAVLTEPASWDAQQALAQQQGGYLATVLSGEEQAFVMSLVSAAEASSPSEGDYYWFGLFQDPEGAEPRGGWQWLSGELLDECSFVNWGFLEPNNQGGEDHGCIHKLRGTWNDGRWYFANRAIAEREAPAPPPNDTTPPSLLLHAPEPAILPISRPEQLKPVVISGQVCDDDSGVAVATIAVGDEYGELDAQCDVTGLLDAGGQFALTIELSPVVMPSDRDGRSYAISLSAVDSAGNEAGPEIVTVLAPPDTTPPSLLLDSPSPAILYSARPGELQSVTISGQVTDDESGVASATITLDDEYGEFDARYDVTGLLDAAGAFALNLQLSGSVEPSDRDGRTYAISLTAVDCQGNAAGPETVIVLAQRPGPGNNPGRGNGQGPPENPGNGRGNHGGR
ncbi:MAG: lectin-like protein [Armatimonadota bacterium]